MKNIKLNVPKIWCNLYFFKFLVMIVYEKHSVGFSAPWNYIQSKSWFFNIVYFSSFSFFTWAFFYFPYIKKGTKALFVQIAINLITIPFFIIESIKCFNKQGFSALSTLNFLCIVFSLIYVYFSINFFKINRSVRRLALLKK